MTFHVDKTIGADDSCIDYSTIVKNTFIHYKAQSSCSGRRLKSLPASLRLCIDYRSACQKKELAVKPHYLRSCTLESEVSTDASVDGDSEDKSPLATDLFSAASLDGDSEDKSPFGSESEETTYALASCTPRSVLSSPSVFSTEPMVSSQYPVPPPPRPLQRLNPKASAFEPQMWDLSKKQYCHHIQRVINAALQRLQGDAEIANIELCTDFLHSGVSFTIQVKNEADAASTERIRELAKEALLTAAGQSKSIYVLGYASLTPFKTAGLGFQGTLGVMENARFACWHMFKKGFCQHGESCTKSHPALEVPVRVLIESARFSAPLDYATDFKLRVLDLVTGVTSMLERDPYVAGVQACRDKASKGWTVSLLAKVDDAAHGEHALDLAKKAVFTVAGASNMVHLMGSSEKPFHCKSNGFVATLGDMPNESRACWDFYSLGSCRKSCGCRWEHPTCYIPISIVLVK